MNDEDDDEDGDGGDEGDTTGVIELLGDSVT
jgi:hypothetical protein